MWQQIKYSARSLFHSRWIVLAVMLGIDVFFCLTSAMGLWGMAGQVVAVTLSSCALFATFVAVIATDCESIRALFWAPYGYLDLLTPVPRWKILLARILTIVVMDIASMAVGICGVVIHSLILSGGLRALRAPAGNDVAVIVALSLLGLLIYLFVLLLCFFIPALCKSVFYRFRGKALLGGVCGLLILYVYDLALLLVGAVAPVVQHGMLFSVMVQATLNPAMLVLMGLMVLENVALFAGTVYLMERKINI